MDSANNTKFDNNQQYGNLIVQNYNNIKNSIHAMRTVFLQNFNTQIETGKITHEQASNIFKEEVLTVINDITLRSDENKTLSETPIHPHPNGSIALQTSDNIIHNRQNINIDTLSDNNLLSTISVNPTSNTEAIQQRLYGCYHLEHLYINKHNEILTLFQFIILLHDKFQCTLKYLLYVLAVLNTHTCPYGGPVPSDPITVQLPNKVIGNISQLIKDQKTITDQVNTIKAQFDNVPLKDINKKIADTIIKPQK